MDFKTGKTIEIIKEFLAAGGDKFEINGIDLSKAVFMYRERSSSFIPIPKGNYTTSTENNILYLNVTGDVKTKAYEYQIIYTSDMKAGKYLEDYPELRVLVGKYNDLVEDVTNIIKYAKTSGAKIDSLKMTQVLTQLEPNTFWVMNADERLEAFPIGDLNSKYQEMINKLKKEVEELIKTTKEKALSDINDLSTSKLNDFQNELTKKLKELETLSDELKNSLSSAVTKYIADNRDKLKGDRGPGITSITATGDKVTVNYDDNKNTIFTVPTVPGKDGQGIKDLSYTNNKLKITMSDNSSKEVEIKSGLSLRKIFLGELIIQGDQNDVFELGNSNWKVLVFKYDFNSDYSNFITTIIFKDDSHESYKFHRENSFITDITIKNNKISFINRKEFRPTRILEVYVLEE